MTAPATAIALILCLVGGGSVGGGTVDRGGATVEPTVPAEHVVVSRAETPGSSYERGSVEEWAMERFDEAGLDLPAVRISRHADKDPCNGNTALAVHAAGVARVEVCLADGAPDVIVRKALLHELAHVWARTALSDDQRDAFSLLRGCPAWANGPWEERGSEHAAEVVAWALMDRELLMVMISDHEPEQLAEAYRFLTGTDPGFRQV